MRLDPDDEPLRAPGRRALVEERRRRREAEIRAEWMEQRIAYLERRLQRDSEGPKPPALEAGQQEPQEG